MWPTYLAEKEAEEVVDLSNRGYGGAPPHPTAALINGYCGWYPADFFGLRSIQDRQVLARKGRKAIQVAALALGKKHIKGKSRLSGPRDPGDYHQLVTRQIKGEIPEIMLPGFANPYCPVIIWALLDLSVSNGLFGSFPKPHKKLTRMRCGMLSNLFWSACGNNFASLFTAFRPKVNDIVSRLDYIQVMFYN